MERERLFGVSSLIFWLCLLKRVLRESAKIYSEKSERGREREVRRREGEGEMMGEGEHLHSLSFSRLLFSSHNTPGVHSECLAQLSGVCSFTVGVSHKPSYSQ